MSGKKSCKILVTAALSVLIFAAAASPRDAAAKTKTAERNVKVGGQIRIKPHGNPDDVRYKSNDETVAFADENGIVTAKKEGTALIRVKRDGEVKEEYTVNVAKADRKPPRIPVSFSEVSIQEVPEYDEATGTTVYRDIIANDAETGRIKKIKYFYDYYKQDEKKTVTLTAENIRSWNSKNAIRGGADYTGPLSELELARIEMRTGDALYTYDAEYDEYDLKWGTNDNEPPKITGLVKEKSYTGDGDIMRIYYADMKNTYDFTQFAEAYDERDGKVKIKADTSKINWNRDGTYTLYLTAEDDDGNKAKSWAKVKVYHPGKQERIADGIINRITRKSWSDESKARAIYSYVRSHVSYSSYSPHSPWRTEAMRAINYGHGNCYTYYSITRLLLSRAGIPNAMIKRYPTPGGRKHYWNLAYVNGGWYHFDTTPRRGVSFCLLTDSQLWGTFGGYVFKFRLSYYPERAARRLT